ncbi:MAG TPA: dTDP-4-amino-4,6-dideoxygalactose transaminase [Candidatus Acidoferrum sp.]|nr:dTDP-4-amino-4,6-dideoxygalactose transaminase [Candidatus Acidoferrum sp.]
MMPIPFNKPFLTGHESSYIAQAHADGQLAGDGVFTAKCSTWLTAGTGADRALLTHSCTAALEMTAILAGIAPGDEVIMPSYTFVSTANAFVLRGAVPVFVDIRPDTLNIDESRIEAAITGKTRAIVCVHYAGVACAMEAILALAARYRLLVIEDAAQAIMASYRGKPLGSWGQLGAMSFHETKNVIAGEGGALLVNDPAYADRAEAIRNKGTDRARFMRGQVDKYSWVDVGSSYLMGELVAAFLWAQMEAAPTITARRLALWESYHQGFAAAETSGKLRRPIVPAACAHNAHLYYLLLRDGRERSSFIAKMAARGIDCVFHYVPLHSSPMGRKVGRVCGAMTHTDEVAERLVRLPLWLGLEARQHEVIEQALVVL